MYYEEKLINGVLMFKNNPDGEWKQCSIIQMGERILTLELAIQRLQNAVDSSARILNANSSELK